MTMWTDDPYGAEWDALLGSGEHRYGLHGKKGGGSSAPQSVPTTTTQKSEPWAAQKPYLEYGYQQAKDLYQGPSPQFYPEATYVPMPEQSAQALAGMEERALAGSPISGAGQQEYLDTLSGKYIGAENPYLPQLTTSLSNAITPEATSLFGEGGRAGSGAHEEWWTEQMSDALAPYLYGDYSRERGYMQDAMLGAPDYAAREYDDLRQLAAVGEAYRGEDQQALNDAMARWDFEQNIGADKLAQYMAVAGGGWAPGTTTTTGQQFYTNPQRSDPWQNILGLGSLGLGAYNVFSSRDFKESHGAADSGKCLDAVREMPISAWYYKPPIIDSMPHIGPFAEDWQAHTGLGDGRTINVIDAMGVLLAAVKELDEQVRALRTEIREAR